MKLAEEPGGSVGTRATRLRRSDQWENGTPGSGGGLKDLVQVLFLPTVVYNRASRRFPPNIVKSGRFAACSRSVELTQKRRRFRDKTPVGRPGFGSAYPGFAGRLPCALSV